MPLAATGAAHHFEVDADADFAGLCPRIGTGILDQSALVQFLPLVLIFVVFYFLLIRPQQKKQKDHRAMLDALRRGDRVVTGGGILGTVVEGGEPGGGRGRSRPERAGAGAAQHDLERLAKPDPAAAREAAKEREAKEAGKGTGAPRRRQGTVSIGRCVSETTSRPRLTRPS